MKQMKKNLSLVLVLALLIGMFGNVSLASAASKSSWSVKTGSGIVLEVSSKAEDADTIYMKKNQFQDFNIYKSGVEIKETDSRYEITWSSSDEDVIWINSKTGKSRADRSGTMKEETGEAVITAKIKNKVTKAIAYRKFNVVVGKEKPEPTPTVAATPTTAPTNAPTVMPTPTKAPEVFAAVSIALRLKGDVDSTQSLLLNQSYVLETLVYDEAGKQLDVKDVPLYYAYFSDKDGIVINGSEFKAAKEGEYTITVGAYKSEKEAKSATSAENALLTAQLKDLVVVAPDAPAFTDIQQTKLSTVRLTLNSAEYAKALAEKNDLLKIKCILKSYTYTVPLKSITLDKEDEYSVIVEMRSKFKEATEYLFSYEGYQNVEASLIGSDTEPASIELVGGFVEVQEYYPLEVKVFSGMGVDITDVTYYNIRYEALNQDLMSFSYHLNGDRLWFAKEGETALIEATLDLGYDNKGNKLPELSSVAEFISIPEIEPVYTEATQFTLVTKADTASPEKLTYSSKNQIVCLDDKEIYPVAAFTYIDEKRNQSTQYIAAGKDTTGNNYSYTYYSADTSILLVSKTTGGLVPIKTGSTAILVMQHKELPINEDKGEIIATIPITIAPERALDAFSIAQQSAVKLSATGSQSADEYITLKLLAYDQQRDPVNASYTFSIINPQDAIFNTLFNYSISDGVLKIWEGPGLSSYVPKNTTKNFIISVTASFNKVQKQQNFQISVKNTTEAKVYSSELFVTNPRVDLALDRQDMSSYTSTVQVRSIDNNGYFVRLENLKLISNLSEASKVKGEHSILITNALDDSAKVNNLVIENKGTSLEFKLLTIKDNLISKSENAIYKITLLRGDGTDAVPIGVKGLEVCDTTTPIVVTQTKFDVLNVDEESVKDTLTFRRGAVDISKYVTIHSMKYDRVDSFLVVRELYAYIDAQEMNDAWPSGQYTAVTISLETPLTYTIGQ